MRPLRYIDARHKKGCFAFARVTAEIAMIEAFDALFSVFRPSPVVVPVRHPRGDSVFRPLVRRPLK